MAEATLTTAPNPVAETVPQVSAIQQLQNRLQEQWAKEAEFDTQVPWYQFWKQPIVSHKATLFLLTALDSLVLAVDKDLTLNGPQKKAVVLTAMTGLYAVVVAKALPKWAKPFGGVISAYIINVLMSNSIDFLVAKYHSAVWAESTAAAPKNS